MLNYESLKIFTGIDNKEKCITSELLDRQLGWDNVAYMGDAENDLPPMKKALFTGCPADAIEEVRENSNYISDFPGGRGAVYDFCMHIYKENDKENR
jgi:3-deoxy-D-manno-octulosonate 8-phosphate phosphatase (KDO 8-P phosphatase)